MTGSLGKLKDLREVRGRNNKRLLNVQKNDFGLKRRISSMGPDAKATTEDYSGIQNTDTQQEKHEQTRDSKETVVVFKKETTVQVEDNGLWSGQLTPILCVFSRKVRKQRLNSLRSNSRRWQFSPLLEKTLTRFSRLPFTKSHVFIILCQQSVWLFPTTNRPLFQQAGEVIIGDRRHGQ